MGNLSFNAKRIVVAIPLSIVLFCAVNYFFDLGVFGPFGKKVLVASTAVLVVALLCFGPTVQEIYEHRDKKRSAKK